jgi:putative GTP pyrophosphokinase
MKDTNKLSVLRAEYDGIIGSAKLLMEELVRQLNHLIAQANIPLALPVEFRTKSWVSIEEKLARKEFKYASIKDIPDLIGLRAILLFKRDYEKLSTLIKKHLKVLGIDDKATIVFSHSSYSPVSMTFSESIMRK